MNFIAASLALVLSFVAASDAFARSGSRGGYSGSHSVKGYTTKNGSYVAPHYRTNPNATRYDNWSTKGNVNPYTGRYGTK